MYWLSFLRFIQIELEYCQFFQRLQVTCLQFIWSIFFSRVIWLKLFRPNDHKVHFKAKSNLPHAKDKNNVIKNKTGVNSERKCLNLYEEVSIFTVWLGGFAYSFRQIATLIHILQLLISILSEFSTLDVEKNEWSKVENKNSDF